MSRVTCRCGEVISVKSGDGPERVECPKCGARIRLRRKSPSAAASALIGGMSEAGDGYVRFSCPCGRRLKVRETSLRQAGKCPDCGRMVPIPEGAGAMAAGAGRVDPDAKTADLDARDWARLEEWAARYTGRSPGGTDGDAPTPTNIPPIEAVAPSMVSFEAGLRVCPRCGKPVHLSATTCRDCGAAVPRR